jgi:hypothetical protein
MAGVLTFSEYLGGPDNIKVEQIFPSTQRTYTYNFGQNITGWTWGLDHQTLVVDPISFDRFTGEPNFANSQVIGYFPKVDLAVDTTTINVVNATTGVVNITIPGGLYTGPILPDARAKVPVTIVGVTWTTPSSTGNPSQTNTHRWALLQCYEPDVSIGSPTASTNPLYTAITA